MKIKLTPLTDARTRKIGRTGWTKSKLAGYAVAKQLTECPPEPFGERFVRFRPLPTEPRQTIRCRYCKKRVHFDPHRPGLRVAIRCEQCLLVFCRPCARKHFKHSEGPGKKR